jgi:hypothetical protein
MFLVVKVPNRPKWAYVVELNVLAEIQAKVETVINSIDLMVGAHGFVISAGETIEMFNTNEQQAVERHEWLHMACKPTGAVLKYWKPLLTCYGDVFYARIGGFETPLVGWEYAEWETDVELHCHNPACRAYGYGDAVLEETIGALYEDPAQEGVLGCELCEQLLEGYEVAPLSFKCTKCGTAVNDQFGLHWDDDECQWLCPHCGAGKEHFARFNILEMIEYD